VQSVHGNVEAPGTRWLPMARTPTAIALAAFLLAGCSAQDPLEADAALDGRVPGGAALSFDSIPAPAWTVGQWWEWEISLGDATLPDTFCSIVVATEGGTYMLATEDDASAKHHAALGNPLLGPVSKGNLAMTGYGMADWALLSFPLTDGKAWTTSIPNIAWDIFPDRVDVAMAATFVPRTAGAPPLVSLAGMADGHILIEAEYDPATGWFSSLRVYDVDPGQEELEVGFRAKSTGADYTGAYLQHAARPVLQLDDRVGFNNHPADGGQPYTQAPQPHGSFTLAEGKTLYGYIIAETVVGARAVSLVDPNHQARHIESVGDLNGNENALFLDEPAVAGEWQLISAGIGGFSGLFAQLFEITEGSFTM
jgi:hypothetical protein